MKNKFTVLDLTYMAACAALMAVGAWISIPATISFTLQLLAIFFAITFLGGKKGTISIVVYILLGAVGVPVFAGFKGGLACLTGPTGGYIVGFIIMGLIYWLFEVLLKDKFKIWLKIAVHVLSLIVLYIFGTVWFVFVYTKSPMTFWGALSICVIPYIIPDLIKLALGFSLGLTVKKALSSLNK